MSHSSHPYFCKRDTLMELYYVQFVLRKNLCRVYPTRHAALNPPAQAVRVNVSPLNIPCLPEVKGQQAIVVFLPDDYKPHLQHMAQTMPQVHVHSDIGLQSQEAYLAYSSPALARQLPMVLWLELSELMAALAENAKLGEEGVPLVLLAGDEAAVTWFAPDEAYLQTCRDALTAAKQRPVGHEVQDVVKARQKAERYGERPWLFMRYELQAGTKRCAVNWALFGSLDSDPLGS